MINLLGKGKDKNAVKLSKDNLPSHDERGCHVIGRNAFLGKMHSGDGPGTSLEMMDLHSMLKGKDLFLWIKKMGSFLNHEVDRQIGTLSIFKAEAPLEGTRRSSPLRKGRGKVFPNQFTQMH